MAAKKKPAKDPVAPAKPNGAPPKMTPPRPRQALPPGRRPMVRDPMGGPGFDENNPQGDDALVMPTPEERLQDWLEATLFARNKSEVVLELCHVKDAEIAVCQWAWPDDLEEQDASSIAATIYGRAEEETESLEIPSAKFCVNALDRNSRRFARIMFRVVHEDALNPHPIGGDDEVRHSTEGHLAQAYRHTEQFARFALAMQLSTGRQNLELHRELGLTRTQLHQQQIQSVELFQNMKDREALRQIMIGKHKRAELVKDAAMGLVMKFAPHVAQRIGLVTDDEAAQLQTTDAVSDWLAAMPQEEARLMIEGIADPQKRAAFARAWELAKKRAAGRAARAALTGQAPPLQMAASSGANTNGAAAAGTTKTAAASDEVVFTPDEVSAINKTTMIVLYMLFNMQDAILGMVMPRIPTEAHDEIRKLRERIRTEGDAFLAEEGTTIVKSLRPHVIKMLGGASEQDVTLLLTQIDNPGHKTMVQQTYALVRSKLKSAAA